MALYVSDYFRGEYSRNSDLNCGRGKNLPQVRAAWHIQREIFLLGKVRESFKIQICAKFEFEQI